MFNLDLIQQAEHQCDCLHVNIPFRQSQSKIRHSYLPRNYTCIRIYTCTVYEMGRSSDFEILDRDDFGDSFAYGTPRNTLAFMLHAPTSSSPGGIPQLPCQRHRPQKTFALGNKQTTHSNPAWEAALSPTIASSPSPRFLSCYSSFAQPPSLNPICRHDTMRPVPTTLITRYYSYSPSVEFQPTCLRKSNPPSAIARRLYMS